MIMVELAVVKSDHLYRYMGPRWRFEFQSKYKVEAWAAIEKGRQIVKLSTANAKLQNNSAETRREQQNWAASNKYYNMIFRVYNHN